MCDDGYKKVNGNKLSALVDRNGLPLACTVAPANVHDSRLYEPTLKAFEIQEVLVQPTIISADAGYDAREIRQYNRNRGIRSNIPINRRSRKYPKRGRPFWFLIQNSTKNAVPSNGSSAGSRRLRRLYHDTSGMSTHSWD
jgi:hypothetical protein